MNTTGNSSPFALCSVISVTASASAFEPSTLGDERRALQEMIERREADLAPLVGDLSPPRRSISSLHVLEALRPTRALRRAGIAVA